MADLTRIAERLNRFRDERERIGFQLLQGVATLTNGQVHALKRRYTWVARQIQRLERRLR